MIAVAISPNEWTLADILVVCAVVAYAVKTVADQRGWSRSSVLLRQENVDLTRRNDELMEAKRELEEEVKSQGRKIAILESQVAELRERDQAAVLEALARHEQRAAERAAETAQILERIAVAIEHPTTEGAP